MRKKQLQDNYQMQRLLRAKPGETSDPDAPKNREYSKVKNKLGLFPSHKKDMFTFIQKKIDAAE